VGPVGGCSADRANSQRPAGRPSSGAELDKGFISGRQRGLGPPIWSALLPDQTGGCPPRWALIWSRLAGLVIELRGGGSLEQKASWPGQPRRANCIPLVESPNCIQRRSGARGRTRPAGCHSNPIWGPKRKDTAKSHRQPINGTSSAALHQRWQQQQQRPPTHRA